MTGLFNPQVLTIFFVWAFFWLPGLWLHKRAIENEKGTIHVPLWLLLPFGFPNSTGVLDAWGMISQLVGFWISITLLLELLGIIVRPMVALSMLGMGLVLIPVSVILELRSRRKG